MAILGLIREVWACTKVVAGGQRNDECSLEAEPAGLADECEWIGRKRGVRDDSMVFALTNQVDRGEHLLRWKDYSLGEVRSVLFWPCKNFFLFRRFLFLFFLLKYH